MARKSASTTAEAQEAEQPTANNETANQLAGEAAPEVSAAQAAVDEVMTAAANAEASLQKEIPAQASAESAAAPEAMSDEQREALNKERVERLMQRAKRQKQLGRAGLEKVFAGAMSVNRHAELNDGSVASSLERFFSVIDDAFYVIERRGEMVLGETQAQEILAQMALMADEFEKEASDESARIAALLDKERSEDMDGSFLEPSYTMPAIKIDIRIKHPKSMKVYQALSAYDRVVRDMEVLRWNGKVSDDLVDQARLRQKRRVTAIFVFAARSLRGMGNRIAGKGKQQRRPSQAVAEAA